MTRGKASGRVNVRCAECLIKGHAAGERSPANSNSAPVNTTPSLQWSAHTHTRTHTHTHTHTDLAAVSRSNSQCSQDTSAQRRFWRATRCQSAGVLWTLRAKRNYCLVKKRRQFFLKSHAWSLKASTSDTQFTVYPFSGGLLSIIPSELKEEKTQ